jgi:putative transposase
MSQSLAIPLVSNVLGKAIEARRPQPGELLRHSDRGCQTTGDAYRGTLRSLGIECSMNRTGCCYDNAVMERFFWSIKYKWTNHEAFAGLKKAQLSVFQYIEMFGSSAESVSGFNRVLPTVSTTGWCKSLRLG